MSFVARLKSWLRAATSRSRLENEMDEELAFHLENYARELVRRGVPPQEAARRARIELGGVTVQKEQMRASLGLRLWDDLRADLRFATRMLAKSPGFALVAVGSLALGIGANTAIFTLAKQVLLDRLAVPHPEQLLLFHWTAPRGNVVHQTWGDWDETPGGMLTSTSFPYPAYEALRRENQKLNNGSLEDIFGFKDAGRTTLTVDGAASVVQAEMVSGNYYDALGVRPALGRAILSSDDGAPGSGAVVVISDALWTRAFGRSPDVIGRTIHLNLKPVTIVGVNAPEFTGAKSTHVSPDVFLPFSMQPVIVPKAGGSLLGDADFWWMQMMARVKPGVPAATAQAALDTGFQAWMHANLGGSDQHAGVADATHATGGSGKNEAYPHLTLADGSRGLNESARTLKQPVFVLMGLAGLTLLLACANIANLLLARAAARQREMGVRMALGAGRARILRQVMTESLLLSGLGGVAGLALGYAARNVVPALLAPPWETMVFRDQFDWRVFAFTAAVTAGTGLLFGMAPALKATRTRAGASLKDSTQTVTQGRRGFAGKAIVAFQVALSTLLVVGAVLFVRTLVKLDSVNPGFRTDHLVLFSIQLPKAEYPPPTDVARLRSLEEALRWVPGVASVTLADQALISGSVSTDDFIRMDKPRGKKRTGAWDLNVGQSFFETMGIPIVAGRAFLPTDTPGAPKVAVINEALAREFFPNENPIGKMFRGYYFMDKTPFEIVGVSADTRYNSLRQQPPATYYVLYSQLPQTDGQMTFEVRTRMEPTAIVPSLRKTVAAVDRNLPLMDVRTQAEQIDESIGQERLMAALTMSFGVLALVLACIGIYGLMAYTVARRTNEIGLRLALGAQRGQVMGMVLREALWLTAGGVIVGGAAALMVTRSLKSMLFGLSPNDPSTLVAATLMLLAAAVLAALLPARAAARVSPMLALRHD
jgi:predicted permease